MPCDADAAKPTAACPEWQQRDAYRGVLSNVSVAGQLRLYCLPSLGMDCHKQHAREAQVPFRFSQSAP